MIKTLIGLRSILILFIFCTHFRFIIDDSEIGRSFFEILFLGRYGILFFILLSGFCIALGYTHIFSKISKENLINFFKRRLIKIYPLYMLIGLISLIFLKIPQHGTDLLNYYVYCYIPMIQSWNIVKIYGDVFSVSWFISTIFFCYLLTPLILFLLNKIKPVKFHILFCIINYLILLVYSLNLIANNDTNNLGLYTSPYIRLFEYMIGLDIGLIYTKIMKNKMNFNISYTLKSIIDILFVFLFLFCIYGLPNDLLTRHALAMPLFCCFMIYLCYEKRSILYDLLSSNYFIFIGSISYEFYLIHYLLFEILQPYYQNYIYTIKEIILLFLSLFAISVLTSYIYKIIQDKIIKLFIKEIKNA